MYFMLLGSILEFVYVGLSLENKRRVLFWATPITTCIYILYKAGGGGGERRKAR